MQFLSGPGQDFVRDSQNSLMVRELRAELGQQQTVTKTRTRENVTIEFRYPLSVVIITLLGTSALIGQEANMPMQESVHIASGVHQLFLDDVMIAEQTNLISTLHPPTKFVANPVVIPTPGVETGALLYGTVLYDERAELFNMWYYTGREGTQMHRALAYATSEDGITWEKPNLDVIPGLGEPANIVMVHPQTENFGEPFSVIIDDRDPDPARRYKLVYRYLTPPPEVAALGTTTAVSADGIHWQPFEEVQMPDIIDIGHFFFDELTGKYTVYGRLWAERRKVQMSVSDDFVTWTEPVLVLDINENDPPGSQFYTLAVYNDSGQYVGLGQLYTPGTTHLLEFELLSSRRALRSWIWPR